MLPMPVGKNAKTDRRVSAADLSDEIQEENMHLHKFLLGQPTVGQIPSNQFIPEPLDFVPYDYIRKM